MKTSEVLKNAKALIDTPDKWCQRKSASDASDRHVSFDDPRATKYCAGAAIFNICYPFLDADSFKLKQDAMRYVKAEIFLASDRAIGLEDITIPEWNDRSTHSAVMAVFDAAIKNAERDEEAQNGSGG